MSSKQRLVALASGVALVGLSIVAEARDGRAVKQEATAPAATTVMQTEPAEAKAAVGQAAAEQIVQTAACARKVKVVYAGYGESSRAGCPSKAD